MNQNPNCEKRLVWTDDGVPINIRNGINAVSDCPARRSVVGCPLQKIEAAGSCSSPVSGCDHQQPLEEFLISFTRINKETETFSSSESKILSQTHYLTFAHNTDYIANPEEVENYP